MIVVDTSVWIDHLRRGSRELETALNDGEVLIHPFVIGELSCGTMRNRSGILHLLRELPHAPSAGQEEVLTLVERERLWGRGLGWVDVHLVASTLLCRSLLWTLDRSLFEVAESLGLAYVP